MQATIKTSLEHWDADKVFFVVASEDGDAFEPAVLFHSYESLRLALDELTRVEEDNPVRMAVKPLSQEVIREWVAAFLECIDTLETKFAVWLNPLRKPRVEILARSVGRREFFSSDDIYVDWYKRCALMESSGRVTAHAILALIKDRKSQENRSKRHINQAFTTISVTAADSSARIMQDDGFELEAKTKIRGNSQVNESQESPMLSYVGTTGTVIPKQKKEGLSKIFSARKGAENQLIVVAPPAPLKTLDQQQLFTEVEEWTSLEHIRSMVREVVCSSGHHGGKLSNGSLSKSKALYICGTPGSMKKLEVAIVCQHVLDNAVERTSKVWGEGQPRDTTWRFWMENAQQTRTPLEFFRNIAPALGCDQNDMFQQLHHSGLVLVVDEIDSMLKRSPDWKCALQTLLGYANNENLRFALIGISNSIIEGQYCKLQRFGEVSSPSRMWLLIVEIV